MRCTTSSYNDCAKMCTRGTQTLMTSIPDKNAHTAVIRKGGAVDPGS